HTRWPRDWSSDVCSSDLLSGRVGIGWIIAPFALMLSLSIAGIGSAWLGGSARIPFVAGLDSYMPDWLGKIHPKYATPYAALIVRSEERRVGKEGRSGA